MWPHIEVCLCISLLPTYMRQLISQDVVNMLGHFILFLQQNKWSVEPHSVEIYWYRGWRTRGWCQKNDLWRYRWAIWPPRCRRTPVPFHSPHRFQSVRVWGWLSGRSRVLFGRSTRSHPAGWGTSSHGRGLRWFFPSDWQTDLPLPGPSLSFLPPPPRRGQWGTAYRVKSVWNWNKTSALPDCRALELVPPAS